ncbi:hypothetical protein ACFQ44_10770 [Levilactobacillus lanxiensis]|uniref:D-alanyl-D-alanine carboxypeptidase n=1 Tax=Levilactobacillus lanxiensis TaxID=2799568 RepID=A0ABW4D869_9LACO|nr:hypothetical protein [Levilactobacillus lanxiensis]
MNKLMKTGLLAALSIVLVAPSLTTPASAKSKVKVLSTSKVAHKTYHGSMGNIYSSAKLTHRKYKMSKYRYTTWTATKKAVIKNHGKKGTLAYIKSGSKSGWIYKKYLRSGKAPFNKQKRLNDTYTAYLKALMPVNRTDKYTPTERSYDALASSIENSWGDNGYNGEDEVKVAAKDKDALINAYAVFKNRFSGSQRKNLDAMAKQLDNLEPITDNLDEVGSTMGTFAQALSTAVGDLS